MDDALNSNDDYNNESEKEHFFKIVHAFKSYRGYSQSVVMKRLSYMETLPSHQQVALKAYKSTLEQVLSCIEANHRVIELITEDVEKLFENVQHADAPRDKPLEVNVGDVEKVQVTLKQIYRDWTHDGVMERIQAYQPILDELESRFPSDSSRRREDINILVPGAGLGRLAFEIAKLGFSCQGNEFSLFMLFASNFILNRCAGVNLYRIFPWTQSCDNNMSSEDMIRPVAFPDVDPSILYKMNSGKTRFTMVAGDFLEVYTTNDEWDCIATCFFIDCASNIFTFIEHIYRILKPGGVWINLGPLQYHFSSSNDEFSIEPSYEEVKTIIKSVGFQLQNESTKHATFYCLNRTSMLKQHYDSVFFTCLKPGDR
ncbi:hypothetical protein GE061_017932 [Apolygus lucorum]|uniref:carnosine N-methyltransferase n=1 Tax=Apolygus lucorum TaxID=248454 RepID=A0A8S9XF38_APOLU|nr:hypothetical protein GE061_017932 [Apolygus lucorum]